MEQAFIFLLMQNRKLPGRQYLALLPTYVVVYYLVTIYCILGRYVASGVLAAIPCIPICMNGCIRRNTNICVHGRHVRHADVRAYARICVYVIYIYLMYDTTQSTYLLYLSVYLSGDNRSSPTYLHGVGRRVT
ncbi:hypothetical protein F4811DRAFT_523996 [Daldinia bambusicola]|nr:hypothetical protein F4811DRAFT_523996 [Daldinia bambusicola]